MEQQNWGADGYSQATANIKNHRARCIETTKDGSRQNVLFNDEAIDVLDAIPPHI